MQNDQKLSLLDWLMLSFFSVYYILPSISVKIGILQIIAIGLIYIIIRNRFVIPREIVKYFLIFVIIGLLYALLVDATDISSAVSNVFAKKFYSKFYQLFMMFFPLYLFNVVIERASNWQKWFIITAILFLFLYVEFTTRSALLIDDNITRSWGNYSNELRNMNIGHYAFVYSIPALTTLMFIVYLNSRSIVLKISMILLIIAQFGFLLVAQYTLAFFATIIGVVLILVNFYSGTKMSVFLAFGLIIILPQIPSLIKLIADTVSSESMSLRLYEVFNFFTSGDSSGYNLSGRMELYKKAIIAFLQSPFWGNRSLDFYGHATFLVIPAMLGLFGAVPFYYLYFHSYKMVKEYLCENGRQFTPIFIILLFIGFTNPLEAALPVMFVTWFLAPLVIDLVIRDINYLGWRSKDETLEN